MHPRIGVLVHWPFTRCVTHQVAPPPSPPPQHNPGPMQDGSQAVREEEASNPGTCAPMPPGRPGLTIQEVWIKSAATMSEGPGKEFTAFTISVDLGGDVPAWEIRRRFRCTQPPSQYLSFRYDLPPKESTLLWILPSVRVRLLFSRDFSLLESRLRARHGDRLPQIWSEVRRARSLTGAAR
jgi:hypothetical protein